MKQVEMHSHEASRFRALNRMTESIVLRDLDLLNVIDQTIDRLYEDKEAMDVVASAIESELLAIQNYPGLLDEDGSLVEKLEETRDSLAKTHQTLLMKCESARSAPELDADDGVVEAYCGAIDSAARLHNAFNSLCWAIGEHDADLDEAAPGGPYYSAEELLAALKA